MRIPTMIALSMPLLAAGAAHADPGLSSLKGLIPVYIAAFALLVLIFYGVPIRLAFRAKKMKSEGRISRNRLILLLLPAALVGAAGVLDVLIPIGPAAILFATMGVGGAVVYWIFVGLSVLLLYLVWSTYQSTMYEEE